MTIIMGKNPVISAQRATYSFAPLLHEVELKGEKFVLPRAGFSAPDDTITIVHHAEAQFGCFPRDILTSLKWGQPIYLLDDALTFSALSMGDDRDTYTGMQYGQVIHEYPGVIDIQNGKEFRTDYNGSDETLWFIIGHHYRWKKTGDPTLLKKHEPFIRKALAYIFRHTTEDGLFMEDPLEFCGDETQTRVRITIIWDCGLPGRECGRPLFPIAYVFQQGLLCHTFRDLADMTAVVDLGYDRVKFLDWSQRAQDAIFEVFWDTENGYLAMARDRGGLIHGHSLDGLCALGQLEPFSAPRLIVNRVVELAVKELATPFGFRRSPYPTPEHEKETYQRDKIWPIDQRLADEALRRNGYEEKRKIPRGCLTALKQLGPVEAIAYDGVKLSRIGHTNQLWSYCLPDYFKSAA